MAISIGEDTRGIFFVIFDFVICESKCSVFGVGTIAAAAAAAVRFLGER